MKHLFAGVALVLLLSGCNMPNAENPNSLRARLLGTSQPAQAAQVQPTNPPQPTATEQATAQPMQPAQMAGALANVSDSDASVIDVNGADPYEVAQALALAVGGVIGFYLFAIGAHWLITRRGAHG